MENILPYSKIFDGSATLEDYFGSIGYDFDWEAKAETNNNILRNIIIYGYPGDGLNLKEYHGDAYCDKYFLLYTINTLAGVSGAPILEKNSEGFWIKAIHQRNASKIISNTRAALKLTLKMYKNISSNMGGSYLLYYFNLSNS